MEQAQREASDWGHLEYPPGVQGHMVGKKRRVADECESHLIQVEEEERDGVGSRRNHKFSFR